VEPLENAASWANTEVHKGSESLRDLRRLLFKPFSCIT